MGVCFCVWKVVFFFFFFKQKTAYEMRISDWSSDVCSSDLLDTQHQAVRAGIAVGVAALRHELIVLDQVEDRDAPFLLDVGIAPDDRPLVEFDRNDPLCRRVRVAHAVRASTWPRTKGKG